MPEKDLAVQLEEWEGGEEKRDAAAVSDMDDSVLFHSKNRIQPHLQSGCMSFFSQ